MRRASWILLGLASLAMAAPLRAETLAITGARIHTLAGAGVVENGVILVEDGLISAVGADLPVPAEATVIDAAGRVVTPGLFAPFSSIGLREVSGVSETNDHLVTDAAAGAAFSVAAAVNAESVLFGVARVGGVTRALTAPAPGNSIFAGQASLLRLDGVRSPVFERDVALVAAVGEDGAGLAGGSRALALQSLTRAFEEAALYRESTPVRRRAQASSLDLPRQDLEALIAFSGSGRPLAVHANRASDILGAVRALRAMDLDPVIIGGAEAWRVADVLAEAGVPVILDPLANLPLSYDTLGGRLDNATLLHEAGVAVAFMEEAGHSVREIRQYAGNAVAHGLPWEVALAAITRTPAQIWGVDDRLGAIAPGMIADLVVWTGDPLELSTWAETVLVEGREIPMDSRQLRLRDRYRNPRALYDGPVDR
ncbi:MAG: amidohydrolase family protein [Pseudomonadales bacterium]|jgi:imidazolonepropionase-like amidohydrolase|nr:amidohydrolase family protein [Pseudomonadales bacterium]